MAKPRFLQQEIRTATGKTITIHPQLSTSRNLVFHEHKSAHATCSYAAHTIEHIYGIFPYAGLTSSYYFPFIQLLPREKFPKDIKGVLLFDVNGVILDENSDKYLHQQKMEALLKKTKEEGYLAVVVTSIVYSEKSFKHLMKKFNGMNTKECFCLMYMVGHRIGDDYLDFAGAKIPAFKHLEKWLKTECNVVLPRDRFVYLEENKTLHYEPAKKAGFHAILAKPNGLVDNLLSRSEGQYIDVTMAAVSGQSYRKNFC